MNSNLKNDDVVVANQKLILYTPKTHVKISLDTRRQFTDYLNLKYDKNEVAINKNEVKELDVIIRLGIIQAKKQFIYKESTLLHKEKKPRKDVWEKLGKIASEFLKCNTYPNIDSTYLPSILNTALGDKDPRVIKDYRNTVLIYCNYNDKAIERTKDSRLGTLDVVTFVSHIPKQYITTSSTSSFGVE